MKGVGGLGGGWSVNFGGGGGDSAGICDGGLEKESCRGGSGLEDGRRGGRGRRGGGIRGSRAKADGRQQWFPYSLKHFFETKIQKLEIKLVSNMKWAEQTNEAASLFVLRFRGIDTDVFYDRKRGITKGKGL